MFIYKGAKQCKNIAKHVKDELMSLDFPLDNYIILCTDNASIMIGQKKGLCTDAFYWKIVIFLQLCARANDS